MTAKRCVACKLRPQMTSSNANFSYGPETCEPCFEEGGWENSHSDHGHEDIDSYSLKNTFFKTQAEVDKYIAETKAEMADCWICHPELNKAQAPYTPRTGTSRMGVVHTVPLRAPGKSKAEIVQEKIPAAKISTRKGITKLRAEGVELVWEGRRFLRGTVNGKKVRNVSEVFRVLAA